MNEPQHESPRDAAAVSRRVRQVRTASASTGGWVSALSSSRCRPGERRAPRPREHIPREGRPRPAPPRRAGRMVLRRRGRIVVEIGHERLRLTPGDSVLARARGRTCGRTWDARGRILIASTPAGQVEAFFRAVTREMRCHRRTRAVARAWERIARRPLACR